MDILVIDDDEAIRDAAVQIIEDCGHYAEGAEDSKLALEALRLTPFDVVLLDLNLRGENGLDLLEVIRVKHPKVTVVMITGMGSIPDAVRATQLGALDFLEKPFSREQLMLILQRTKRHRQLEVKVEELSKEVKGQHPAGSYESKSTAVNEAMEILFRAAISTAPILLLGESGTGKSMVAKEIHARSGRSDKPFITVNCPALSRDLLESELFGHVKGAFTGAMRDTRGKVHAAEGGTLFLDEIGELPRELQPKLLRLLQEWEYERVGETKTHKADVRMIAATNRDLAEEVKKGEFREDLYFRLNVISVQMPSVRERREDIPTFANQFLEFFASHYGRDVKGFTDGALRAIKQHSWPGNLREMRNAIERAAILAQSTEIDVSDLPQLSPGTISTSAGADPSEPWTGGDFSIEEIETSHMLKVLESAETLTKAAEILGINEATLYRKRKKIGIR